MTAATPQDHKQPKDTPRKVEVMGVTMTISPAIFDDLDMVENLYDLQHADENEEGGFAIVPFLRKLCGKDYTDVKNALRDDSGRIPFEKVGEFVQQLLGQLNPNS
ncbi:hypothetical protein BW14_05040 [Bifidobacterium sp. UTBIF-68]|uniref:hypothetical protein n=1 Tax=Bifidobacterium sp. UTBIF-68 TaxID=1465262 RepID=UPI0011260553|nr:hypothetical protein [Bifidobacterium sp. UTBIF-68]TPF93627.1 hypothetical protein BW14_05040 [Bifidobacterium sp. UTBIF-68]